VSTTDAAFRPIAKSASAQRYTLGVAFPANKPEVVKAQDGRRDVIGPAAIEKAAWEYLADGREIGIWHADGTVGHGRLVESYIYRGPDWHVPAADGTTQVIKAGDWLMGVVWDDAAWELIERGLVDGLSPQGSGLRVPVADAAAFVRS
jgi:Putative phage serine protease XkdF